MTGGRLKRVLPYVGDEDVLLHLRRRRRRHRPRRARSTSTAITGCWRRSPPSSRRAASARSRSTSGRPRHRLPREAARRRRLDQRRLLRPQPRGRPLHRRRRRRSGSRSRCAASPRDGQLATLPPPGLLARHGHAARPQRPRGALGRRARAVAHVGVDAGLLARAARPRHRPHGLQGRVADALADAAWAPHVTGLSHGVPTPPSLYEEARVGEWIDDVHADVRDLAAVRARDRRAPPEVVIHMAAQPLVRRSFRDPRETYETNVMGTVNVLEAVRAGRRRARGRQRHLGQVLRQPRAGAAVRRGRRQGRPRPVLELQGLRRARRRRLPRSFFAPTPTGRGSARRAPATSSAAATGARTG